MKLEEYRGWIITLLFFLFGGLGWYWLEQKPAEPVLTLAFLDVGQGDSIFIKSPTGTQVLIDGGPDRSVLNKLPQYMPYGDTSIDLLVLTHPHSDHLQGLVAVLESYEVAKIALNKINYESQVYEELLNKVAQEKAEVITPLAGDTLEIGGGAVLKVLWPPGSVSSSLGLEAAATDYENVNNASLVFLLDYMDFEALLTGDAEYHVQNQLLGQVGEVELLKVPHQGARDAFNRQFWLELNPEVAIISVGQNSYGHPHLEVLTYLKAKVPKVKRTDQNGDQVIIAHGQGWELLD